MKTTTLIAAIIAIIGSVTGGCTSSVNPASDAPNVNTQSNGVLAVVVGMENSSYFGNCPGAGLDASRMASVLKDYAADIRLLVNTNATKDRVVSALSNAVANAELVIFFYSGHGGQAKFLNTSSAEEADGMDEYLCLDDTYLRDNDVWNLIRGAKSRVWCIFDCCHSQSIFRNAQPLTLPSMGASSLAASHYEDSYDGSTQSFLIWSGCPDNTYSYGSASGGEFTNTILHYFSKAKSGGRAISYDDLWLQVESDVNLLCDEEVQRTVIGKEFGSTEAFR